MVASFDCSLVVASVPMMANRRMRSFDILDFAKLCSVSHFCCCGGGTTGAAVAVDRTFLYLITTSANQLAQGHDEKIQIQ